MTFSNPATRWILALALVVAVLGVVVGITSAAPVQTVPQQAMSCTWTKLPGSFSVPTFHSAYGYDTKKNALYTYGGLDRNNTVTGAVQKVDLASGNPTSASISRLTVSGALERYGAAGAYRPAPGGGENGMLIWISGARNDGVGQSDIQVLDLASNSQRSLTPSGSLQRVFGAAAYDPEHDVVVAVGGAKACSVESRGATATPTPLASDGSVPAQQQRCVGGQLPTQFLSFDASGPTSFSPGPSGGPNQMFGMTMVYDSTTKKMITFGGTTDENANPTADMWALDLSNPLLSSASWSRMSVGGGPSARFFHAASYDANKKWMVVAGGVTRNVFNPGTENTNDETYALDMSGATASWMKLTGATVDGPVGASAGYSGNIMASLYAGGRRRFSTGTQNVSSGAYYLNCAAAPTATATRTAGPATNTPSGGTPNPSVIPPTPTLVMGQVCDNIKNRVPAAAINAALANPSSVQGWGELCNPSLPPSVWNQPRSWLTVRNAGVPYNPLYNGLIWSCGCR